MVPHERYRRMAEDWPRGCVISHRRPSRGLGLFVNMWCRMEDGLKLDESRADGREGVCELLDDGGG